MENHDKTAQLKRWIDSAWVQCQRKQACGNWSENLLLAADHIRRDTDDWDWVVRYQRLGDIQKQAAVENGQRLRPQESKVWRKIARFRGSVVDLAPKPGNKSAWVNEPALRTGRKAVHVRSQEGLTVMLYLDPRTEALMPAGALQVGKEYVFIGREAGLSWNPKDTQPIDLLSYDLAQ
ncbi:MAG: hypothetical protein M3R16_05230, partial [Pseudomonadota bacterium]|nr:hypothetical protein [Pseudomonadota bacterium]